MDCKKYNRITMGHNWILEKQAFATYKKCSICSCVICEISSFDFIQYLYTINNGEDWVDGHGFNLTCEDIIIKGIIE